MPLNVSNIEAQWEQISAKIKKLEETHGQIKINHERITALVEKMAAEEAAKPKKTLWDHLRGS